MADRFVPLSAGQLAGWIFAELEEKHTIFGIPTELFWKARPELGSEAFGHALEAPLGVAAGPHTQLAQNIVVAYLLGARFIELKTVQTLDQLEVSKPCIDADNATFNCEWSQELTLEQSIEQYAAAWVLIHALRHRLGWATASAAPRWVFNASIGYNLEGIKSPKMQAFLDKLRDASELVETAVEAVAASYPAVRELSIGRCLSDNITLSTMHGCPPQEIEEIARYLLAERGFHTAIKLNPTLLGPELLRQILNEELGFDEIVVPDAAFEHDTKYADAKAFIERLHELAAQRGLTLGLKLTNTLEVENHRQVFPPAERMMYLSGRALHPLTINVARLLRQDFGTSLPFSLSGGADAFNFADIVACGLSPVTVCSDLLRPGGYTRLPQYLRRLQAAMADAGAERLAQWQQDPDQALARYADAVRRDPRYRERRVHPQAKDTRPLDHFDCISAPCRSGCPTGQEVPEYLHQVASGNLEGALAVIQRTNPLPQITGCVCDHVCESRCVRNHYDQPLAIRAIKRFVAESTHAAPSAPVPRNERAPNVAVIGAGPAGLSAAYYLAQAGCGVELFDGAQELGGTVRATIPRFRLSLEHILRDVELIASCGVILRRGVRIGRDLSFEQLRAEHDAVVIASGATAGLRIGLEDETSAGVWDGYSFLEQVAQDKAPELGADIVVIGGGNAAMDTARTAWRLAPKAKVQVLYRRTRQEMPADPHEIIALDEEGIELIELVAPIAIESEGGAIRRLRCHRMTLSERDASGRPRPVPVEGSEFSLPCSALLICVSQAPELAYLKDSGLSLTRWHTVATERGSLATSAPGVWAAGDVIHGPATVIQALADGRRCAEAILAAHGCADPETAEGERGTAQLRLRTLLSERRPRRGPTTRPASERRDFEPIESVYSAEEAAAEAQRCLLCDERCDLCVTVCPNLANLSYQVRPARFALPELREACGQLVPGKVMRIEVRQVSQVLNITNFCNECGNCTTFCPSAGAPYRDKPRLHLDRASFSAERDNALFFERGATGPRLRLKRHGEELCLEQHEAGYTLHTHQVAAHFDQEFGFLAAEAAGPIPAQSAVSLEPAAELAILLRGLAALPLFAAR